MSSLDFSHFKKIAQDKKCATLQHPDGHEIKISIANLNPGLRKKLESLPLHQAKGSKKPIEPLDDDSPAEVVDEPDSIVAGEEKAIEDKSVAPTPQPSAPPTPAAEPMAQQPQPAPAPTAPPPAGQPMPAPMASQAPMVEAPSQPQPSVQAPMQEQPAQALEEPIEKTPEQIAADRNQQDMAFANDVQAGHIKPKTYADLYHNKSTLGKISSIFGMILSGIGSGLTGQPNAAMEIMNKQIQNDLEAQEKDQTNRQNMMKLSLEHTKNQFDNELTNSVTTKNWTLNEREQFMNNNNGVVKSIGTLNAENSMLITSYQSQQDLVNRMPAGPQKDKAQDLLNNTIIPAMIQKIQSNNLKAGTLQHDLMNKAKISAQAHPTKKNKEVAKSPEAIIQNGPIDQTAYQNMLKHGKFMSASGFVDPSKGIDPNDNAAVEKAITESNVNWKNYKDVMETANDITKLPNAGQTPIGNFAEGLKKVPFVGESAAALMHMGQASKERPRDIMINSLATRLAGRGASDKTIADVKNALTPNMFDNEKSLKLLERAVHEHFAHNEHEQNGMWTKYPKIKKEMPLIGIEKGSEVVKTSNKRENLISNLNKLLEKSGVAGAND